MWEETLVLLKSGHHRCQRQLLKLGAHWGLQGARQPWPALLSNLFSNARELLAIGEALRVFGREIPGLHVLIQTTRQRWPT